MSSSSSSSMASRPTMTVSVVQQIAKSFEVTEKWTQGKNGARVVGNVADFLASSCGSSMDISSDGLAVVRSTSPPGIAHVIGKSGDSEKLFRTVTIKLLPVTLGMAGSLDSFLPSGPITEEDKKLIPGIREKTNTIFSLLGMVQDASMDLTMGSLFGDPDFLIKHVLGSMLHVGSEGFQRQMVVYATKVQEAIDGYVNADANATPTPPCKFEGILTPVTYDYAVTCIMTSDDGPKTPVAAHRIKQLKNMTHAPRKAPRPVDAALTPASPVRQNNKKRKKTKHQSSSSSGSSSKPVDIPDCPICMHDFAPDSMDIVKTTCGHIFCRECIEKSFDFRGMSCPMCRTRFNRSIGSQPLGTLELSIKSVSLQDGCDHAWCMDFVFPNGTQEPWGPHPDQHYHGEQRTAYFPFTEQYMPVVEGVHRCLQASQPLQLDSERHSP